MQHYAPSASFSRMVGILIFLVPFMVFGQVSPTPDAAPKKKEHNPIGFGIKGGLNFANVTGASSINSSSRAGFHFGVFFSTNLKKVLGSHTELSYSRHGFNYKNDSANGFVNLDYIMLSQLMSINITKYFSIQFGGQTSYLLSVKTDSTKSTGSASTDKLLSYSNRFDSGIGAGVEIHPFMGIIIGARYCYSLTNLFKSATDNAIAGGGSYSISPNLKNNVILISVGYRF